MGRRGLPPKPPADLAADSPQGRGPARALRHPVTVRLDGDEVVADRGEAVAVSLVAAGHLAWARSPKFHRPRGPWCLRGACDGCLARVNGVPNVMTCRTPAEEGMLIETQNVVGTADTDLLRAADWLFPDGMNHHELFAGVPGVQRVVQVLARRIAGLGKLPAEASSPRAAARREVDVLVVGSGASGMATALELERRSRRVEVVDDALAWGGGARLLEAVGWGGWGDLVRAFGKAANASRITVRLRTTAAGIYGDDVLLASDGGVEVVTARTLVLAPGAHDGVLAFEGNDLPGVMSPRAACHLASCGAHLGRHTVVVTADGGGPFGQAYAGASADTVVIQGRPLGVRGGRRPKIATVATADGEKEFACDALVVDARRAPAYELCAQAGAEVAHGPAGFLVNAPGGKIREGVFAVGEVVGTPLNPHAMASEADSVARTADGRR